MYYMMPYFLLGCTWYLYFTPREVDQRVSRITIFLPCHASETPPPFVISESQLELLPDDRDGKGDKSAYMTAIVTKP